MFQAGSSVSQRLGRYHLAEPLGGGPNGEVYRAKVYGVAGFERQFAVKRFHADLVRDPDVAAHFAAAARMYGSLEHPRVARLHEFGVAGGETFTAVELVDGLDLTRLIEATRGRGSPLPLGTAVGLISQAARAIGYAHGLGSSHLGVCPTNLICSREGEVKVTDFGFLPARLPTRPHNDSTLDARTPYLAPEQLAGEKTSRATDVFQLGLITFELLTGQRPFPGSSAFETAQLIMSARPPTPDLPPPLVTALNRALARAPQARFADATAFADAIDAASRSCTLPGSRSDLAQAVKAATVERARLAEDEASGAVTFAMPAPPRPVSGPAPGPALAEPESQTQPRRTAIGVAPPRAPTQEVDEHSLLSEEEDSENSPTGLTIAEDQQPTEISNTFRPPPSGGGPPPPRRSPPPRLPTPPPHPRASGPGLAPQSGTLETSAVPPESLPPPDFSTLDAPGEPLPAGIGSSGGDNEIHTVVSTTRPPGFDDAPSIEGSAPGDSFGGTDPMTVPPVKTRRWPRRVLILGLLCGMAAGGYFAYADFGRAWIAQTFGGEGDEAAGAVTDAGAGTGAVATTGADAGAVAASGTDAGAVAASGTDAGAVAASGTDAGAVAATGADAGAVAAAGTDAATGADAGVVAAAGTDADADAGAGAETGAGAGGETGAGAGAADGRLRITSTPDKAKVYLDGTLVGKTPIEIDSTADQYRLAIIQPGYKLHTAEIKGEGAVSVTLQEVTPSGRIRRHQSALQAEEPLLRASRWR